MYKNIHGKNNLKYLKSRPKELKGIKPCKIKKEKDYVYSRIEFYTTDNILYIKMTGQSVKTKWFLLEDYKQYTALQVTDIVNWGRHFEDGILELWKSKGLRLGWLAHYGKGE